MNSCIHGTAILVIQEMAGTAPAATYPYELSRFCEKLWSSWAPWGVRIISHNTWIHRVVRVGVRPLVDTRVTPNQVTTVRLITGLAAAVAFAAGPAWLYLAAGLFVLSTLLDRADGVLARMSGKTSAWGHTYDIIADALSNIFLFIGVGFALRESMLGHWATLMGAVAGIAVAVVLLFVMRIEAVHGPRAAELGSAAGFDPDDALLLLPLAMLFGWGVQILIASAVIAPLFGVFFLWHFRDRLDLRSMRLASILDIDGAAASKRSTGNSRLPQPRRP